MQVSRMDHRDPGNWSHYPLPPGCVSRKLEWQVQPGLAPTHSAMGCRRPKSHLNLRQTPTPALCSCSRDSYPSRVALTACIQDAPSLQAWQSPPLPAQDPLSLPSLPVESLIHLGKQPAQLIKKLPGNLAGVATREPGLRDVWKPGRGLRTRRRPFLPVSPPSCLEDGAQVGHVLPLEEQKVTGAGDTHTIAQPPDLLVPRLPVL